MQNSQNPYLDLLENDRVKSDFEKFDNTFKVRLFYEKYKLMASFCRWLSWFFNTLSIVTGVFGAGLLLAAILVPNLTISVSIALVVLVLIELCKRFLLRNWVVGYYRDKKLSSGLISANLALILLSGFATVYGGIKLVEMARNQNTPTLVDTKKVEQKYRAKIGKIEAKQKELINRNSYQGKTWLPKSERALNIDFEKQISELKADQKSDITKAENRNKALLKSHNKGTGRYIVAFVLLSLLIESLCIVTLVFPIYYQHRSREDKELIVSNYNPNQNHVRVLAERMGINIEALVLQAFGNQEQVITMPIAKAPQEQQPVAKPQSPIGFKRPEKKEVETSYPKRGTTINYPLINNLLTTTEMTTAQIAKKAGCSDTSVRNARKKLVEKGILQG